MSFSQFQVTYGKPLLAARDSKCSDKDAEAGALVMEALHKQVMPFLVHRTKAEVLYDLPEKIIQDRYLFMQFLGSIAKAGILLWRGRRRIFHVLKGTERAIKTWQASLRIPEDGIRTPEL
ncbi:hypothetical protein AgCh_024802 [Apium graveolens]